MLFVRNLSCLQLVACSARIVTRPTVRRCHAQAYVCGCEFTCSFCALLPAFAVLDTSTHCSAALLGFRTCVFRCVGSLYRVDGGI